MAKKTRRQKQRAATRHPALAQAHPHTPTGTHPTAAPLPASAPVLAPDDTEASSPAPAVADRTPAEAPRPSSAMVWAGDQGTTRRRVGRVVPETVAPPGSALAGRQQRPAVQRSRSVSAAAMVAPLESDDPAIPFDRVPYVPADLRRVAVIAGCMVILILIAWLVVSHVVSS